MTPVKIILCLCLYILYSLFFYQIQRGCRGSDRMVVRLITPYAISAYYHQRCEFESHSALYIFTKIHLIQVSLPPPPFTQFVLAYLNHYFV